MASLREYGQILPLCVSSWQICMKFLRGIWDHHKPIDLFNEMAITKDLTYVPAPQDSQRVHLPVLCHQNDEDLVATIQGRVRLMGGLW